MQGQASRSPDAAATKAGGGSGSGSQAPPAPRGRMREQLRGRELADQDAMLAPPGGPGSADGSGGAGARALEAASEKPGVARRGRRAGAAPATTAGATPSDGAEGYGETDAIAGSTTYLQGLVAAAIRGHDHARLATLLGALEAAAAETPDPVGAIVIHVPGTGPLQVRASALGPLHSAVGRALHQAEAMGALPREAATGRREEPRRAKGGREGGAETQATTTGGETGGSSGGGDVATEATVKLPIKVFEGRVAYGPLVHRETTVTVAWTAKSPTVPGAEAAALKVKSGSAAKGATSRGSGAAQGEGGDASIGVEGEVAGSTMTAGVGSKGVTFEASHESEPLARLAGDSTSLEVGTLALEAGAEGSSHGHVSSGLKLTAFSFKGVAFTGSKVGFKLPVTLANTEGDLLVATPTLSVSSESERLGGELGVEVEAKVTPNWPWLAAEAAETAGAGGAGATTAAETISGAFGTIMLPLTAAYAHLRMFLAADESGKALGAQALREQRGLFDRCVAYSRTVRGLEAGGGGEAGLGETAGREFRDHYLEAALGRAPAVPFGTNPAQERAYRELEEMSATRLYADHYGVARAVAERRLSELAARCPEPELMRRIVDEALADVAVTGKSFGAFGGLAALGR